MTPISDRTEAGTESIERVFSVLLEIDAERTASFSRLEWAGIGALLHDFYNGIENTLEQVVPERVKALAESPDRQRDLVAAAVSVGLISEPCANRLKPYLAFDHYCVLGHALELDPKGVAPLLRDAKATFAALRGEIGATLPSSTKQAQWAAGSCQSETLVESTAACPQAAGGWGHPPLPQPPRAQHPDRRVSRDPAAGYGEPAVPALRPAVNASPDSLLPSHW